MAANEAAQTSIWGRLLAWALLLALLGLVAVQLSRSQRGILTRGEPAPPFTLTTFEGAQLGPEDMAGKVVLVNIWASWCKPCEQEAEALQSAWEQYEGREDVLFLGVDYVDTEPEARLYLKKFGITYPNGPDLATRISQYFRIKGVPETYFIDQDGVLKYVQVGPFSSIDQIRAQIDPLLK